MAQTVLDAGEAQPAADPRRWRTLGFLGAAQFMLIIDVTVVAIALPNMATDLGMGREATTWVVSAYTLAFGGLLLVGGRLADILGSRPVVLTGLALFTAASLVAGSAGSPELLLASRAAQGVGAALLSPAALSAVVRLFDGAERARALGIWSALGGGGAAVGVLLGGVLTAGPGWPWVFYVNVPVGLVVAVAVSRLLPRGGRTPGVGGLDGLGAGLVTLGTGAVIFALIDAGDRGWTSRTTIVLLGIAAVLLVLFAVRQRTARVPLMDLGLLLRRPVASGTFLVVMATALTVAGFFLGTFYLQDHAGYSALVTGVLFLPVALATMAAATVGGRVIGRTGARVLSTGGFAVAAAGFAAPALVDGVAAVVVGLTVGGAGLGVLFVSAAATALGQVAAHEAGIASGIVSAFHEFGASLGAAVISSVAAGSIAGATTAGFASGFGFAAVAAVAAGAASLVLVPGRPPAPVPEPAR
jgi:EmrB/QacA subfamily drug resistance transporter